MLNNGSTAQPQSTCPWETTNQANTNYAKYATPAVAPGPRSLLRDEKLHERAQQIQDAERASSREQHEQEHARLLTTTLAKDSFVAPDPSVWDGVTRVPRGRNGSRIVDPDTQHLTKGEADSIDQMKLAMLGETTVTRYSHAITTGVGLDYPSTFSDNANPFARSSAFSNDIRDPTRRHGEATEPGDDHNVRSGTSVHQRAALRRLGQVLLIDPAVANQLTELLRYGPGESTQPVGREFIELSEFRAAFKTVDTGLTDKEVIHIFMYFDIDNIGAIALQVFLNFYNRSGCRPPSAKSSRLRV